MSGSESRLSKLYPALSARERAVLVLKALKEGGEEDRQVRQTMPSQQAEEFNRYIGLMNAVNDGIKNYIVILYLQVRHLGTRWGWLATLQVWGFEVMTLTEYICRHTGEPVTKSEYKALFEKARSEMVPLHEFVELLVERHEGWAERDFEGTDDETPTISDKAWKRVLAEKKRELRRLVEDGTLKGRRRGRGLAIEAGSFYDWLGEDVPVFPEWGFKYEIIPDEDADRLDRLKEDRVRAREAAEKSPAGFAVGPMLRSLGWADNLQNEPAGWGDEIAHGLLERLKEGITEMWQELGAVDRVVAEVQAQFEGEDPLSPKAREVLDTARKELAEVIDGVRKMADDIELPDPDEEQVERVRGLLPQTTGRSINLGR